MTSAKLGDCVPAVSSHLLVIEDDEDIGRLLIEWLSSKGWVVTHAESIAEGQERLSSNSYDVIILDLMLADGSGMELLESLRAEGCSTPICLLTARDELPLKLKAFDAGADDYVTKPFELSELEARVTRMLNRNRSVSAESPSARTLGNLTIDSASREVFVQGRQVAFTRREFDVLHTLITAQGAVVSRESLLNMAWPAHAEVNLNTVDVYVSYVRKKLAAASVSLETVRGLGFKLVVTT